MKFEIDDVECKIVFIQSEMALPELNDTLQKLEVIYSDIRSWTVQFRSPDKENSALVPIVPIFPEFDYSKNTLSNEDSNEALNNKS